MLGRNYQSFEEFKKACMYNRDPLDPAQVLGKVYQADQLRFVAEKTGVDLSGSSSRNGLESRSGIGSRYNAAIRFSEAYDNEPERIGQILARWDHDLFFPIVTYRSFPNSLDYSSPEMLIAFLRTDHADLFRSDFVMKNNGIRRPGSRACMLESTRIDTRANVLSLLFSCTRILVVPDGQYGSLENYFLARIPVLVRLLFEHRLFEISMPTFSEVPDASSTSPSRVPERYQAIVESAMAAFLQFLPGQPFTISFRKVALYLEELGAEDMGWIIEPQHEATFDLTGLVPLKKVLGSLSEDFRAECIRRGKASHPLASAPWLKCFFGLTPEAKIGYDVSILWK
jgi:hypothetical protein